MGRYIAFIILTLTLNLNIYPQFVNPNEDTEQGTSQTYSRPGTESTANENRQTREQPARQQQPQQSQQQRNETRATRREGSGKSRYYHKMKFTFDGTIEFVGPPSSIRLAKGFEAKYDSENRLINVFYDGKRPFEIEITYKEDGSKKLILWRHNEQKVMKFEFKEYLRYYIKINLFNFIRQTEDLILPDLTIKKTVYYASYSRDKFKRIVFEDKITKDKAQLLSSYYEVSYNGNNKWNIARYYSKQNQEFKIEKVYYCIYYKNGKEQNLRYFDINRENNKLLNLDRSYFYFYNQENKIIRWELYILEVGKEWEVLYETWEFEWDGDDRSTKNRVNKYTDDFLTSAFLGIHFKGWLRKTDDFSDHVSYLESIGISNGTANLMGFSMSFFFPVFKNFFITIEIGWDGMWEKGSNFRYTLNVFTLTANIFYFIPFYRDTFAAGMYIGGGFGVAAADFTQYYSSLSLEEEKAADENLLWSIRAGFSVIWSTGIIGIGVRYRFLELKDFSEGDGKLYYTAANGLRLINPSSAAAGDKKASLDLRRFCIEIFFGFRL